MITPPHEIWGARELEALRKAMADPDYLRRLAADVAAENMVEVDNPFRRELRPRRGTDEGAPDA